jgi:hypothetical protein
MNMQHEGVSHWFLKSQVGRIVDITAEQFIKVPDYSRAVGRGFLTKYPSKRAKQLIRSVTSKMEFPQSMGRDVGIMDTTTSNSRLEVLTEIAIPVERVVWERVRNLVIDRVYSDTKTDKYKNAL